MPLGLISKFTHRGVPFSTQSAKSVSGSPALLVQALMRSDSNGDLNLHRDYRSTLGLPWLPVSLRSSALHRSTVARSNTQSAVPYVDAISIAFVLFL